VVTGPYRREQWEDQLAALGCDRTKSP